MIEKIDKQYYEAQNGQLYGVVVDDALLDTMNEILGEAAEKIVTLLQQNKTHWMHTQLAGAYPNSKYTSFRYVEENENPYKISDAKLFELIKEAFTLKEVKHLFAISEEKFDYGFYDRIKAQIQRMMEDEK